MGSICNVNTRPNTWPVRDNNERLKAAYGGEPLLSIEYGTLEDEMGQLPMEMRIRKPIYDKLISGEYKVSAGHDYNIIIRNKAGETITPISPGLVY